MYDGAGAASAAAAIKANAATAVVAAANPAADGGKHEIVFIDSNVANWQAIAGDVRPGVEVVLFNGNGDGLAEIAGYLAADTAVDAIHIVSHGASGELIAGTDVVTDANLPSYQADLTAISAALKPGGDILLYGCDIAAGQPGAQFVADIATDTGDTVAASSGAVGAASAGGSWTLDTSTGSLSVASIEAPDYTGILSPLPNFTQNFESSNSVNSTTWEYTTGGWSGAVGSSVNGVELTQNGGGQNGLLVYNSSFSAVDGIDLTFRYYMGPQYPGNSADGLAFALLDGSQAVPSSAGSFGGGLGYNSISAGILGIGFDEYGNFTGGHSTTYEGNIVVKGSTSAGNPELTAVQPNSSGTPESPGSGSTSYIEGTATVEVILDYNNANAHYDLTVKLNGITEISNYDVTAAGVSIPSTLRFAFTASTGGSENEHSIENVTVAVPTSVTGVSNASWTGSSAADVAKTATADDTPTLSGTAAAGDTIKVYVDGTQAGTTTADASGNWTYTISTALADGTHALSATDSTAGTSSPGYSLTIDTPPAVTGADGAANHTDAADRPVITGTAAPSTPMGTTITVYSDGTSIGTTTTSDSAGDWSLTPGTAIADGSHSITAKETLGGVTSGASAGYALTITTAPAVTTIDGTVAATTDDNSKPAISGTAAASTPTGSTVTVYVDGTAAGSTTTTNSSGAWSYTPATALSLGSHTITATETIGGVASNSSTGYALTIVAPPVITGLTVASYEGPSAGDAAKTATADGLPVITGTASPNATVSVYDGGVLLGTASAGNTGAWSFTRSTILAVGTHTITAKETISSYISPASGSFSLVIDTPSVYLEAQPSSVSGTYSVTYDVSSSPIAVDTIATVTEDSAATIYTENANYVGGSLTVATTNPTGSDALDIARAATISTTSGNLSVTAAGAVYLGTGSGATQIGSVTGGGTNDLVISFTSTLVTDAAVQVLSRMIEYSNSIGSAGTAPGTPDAVTMTVKMGYGNSSSQTTDIAFTNSHGANNAPTLGLNTTGVNATVGTNGATSAQVVDSSLTLSGSATVTAASVVVQNFQSGDVLGYSALDGLTGSYNSSTGVLSVTGTGTTAQYQDYLRHVTFDTTSTNTTARNISFVVGGGLYDSATNTFFEYIADNGVSWYQAEVLASQTTLDGMTGYLANINSAADNAFVAAKLSGQGWMGASDNAVSPTPSSSYGIYDGHWHWITGPDSMMVGSDGLPGEYFFQQTGGTNQGTRSWPITGGGGYAVGGAYTHWNAGEPNDDVDEAYAHFLNTAYWNDYNYANSSINGYVVEFGGMPTDPTLSVTGNATVDVVSAITVSAPTLAASSDTGRSSSDGITKDTSQVFTGTATGGSTVTLYSGSTVEGTAVANANGNWTINATLAAGSYSLTAKATEFGLTSSTSAAEAVTVDTTAPTVAVTGIGPSTTGDDATDVTASTTPVISGTVSDNVAGTPSVEVSIDGVDVGAATVSNGTWTYTSATLSHGVHEVSVTATDVAGNTSSPTADTAFTVDTPPTIGTSATVANQGVTKTTSMTATEDGTGSLALYAHDADNGDTLVWSVTTQGTHGVAAVSSSGAVTYTPNPGQYAGDSFVVSVTDGLGGTATETVSVTVSAVNHAPVLTLTTPASNETLGATTENATGAVSSGTTFTVANLLAGVTITDSDSITSASIGHATTGIAVTSVDNTNGEWFYSTNNGTTWTAFTSSTGGVESIKTAAVLLNGAATGASTNKVEFVPNANYLGSAEIAFAAWDEPTGQSAGSTVDLTAAGAMGGNGHFSGATVIAVTTVTPVDAPPTLTPSAVAPEFVDAAPSVGFPGSGAPVAVDPLLTVTNPGDVNTANDNITTVTIGVEAGSAVVATDVLAVNTGVTNGPAGLTSSFSSGVLTLNGSGTAAEWQTLLRTLTYDDTATSDTGASTAARTITYTIVEGGAGGTTPFTSDTASKTVNIANITATDALEGIPYTAVPNTFDIYTLDAAGGGGTGLVLTVQSYGGAVTSDTFGLAGGTVSTDGAGTTTLSASGSLYVGASAVATYTDAAGVLTVQFGAGASAPTQDQVNAILNQITYTTASANALQATLSGDNSGSETLLAAVSAPVTAVTPFPATLWAAASNTFDLSALDVADAHSGTLVFTLQNPTTPDVNDAFSLAATADPRGAVTSDSSATQTVLDGTVGSAIIVGSTQVATYTNSGGVLTIDFSTVSQDAIKDVLSQIQYTNASNGSHDLQATLTDDNSVTQTVTTSLTTDGTPMTALPTVIFSGTDPASELTGADPIVMTVERGTVGNLNPLAEDSFSGSGGLSFDGSSVTLDGATIGSSGVVSGGVLTLTLNTGLTDSQINEVLGLIRYTDTSATPTGTNAGDNYTTPFSLVATLSQDTATQLTATTSITLEALNNPPAETLPSGPFSVAENVPLALSGFTITDADAGTGHIVTTVQVDHGILVATVSGSATISGNDTGDLTITGSQSDITATLNSLYYTSTGAFAGTDTLLVSTDDQGLSGVDGPKTTTASVSITVTEVNHAPVLDAVAPVALPAITEQAGSASEATNVAITGTPVADMIPAGAISDADVPYHAADKTTGIAVTSVDNTNGEWYYSTDNGSTWTAFTSQTGGVENISAAAVLLDAAATGASKNLVKFVPNAYWNSAIGPADPSLTYVAWDEADSNTPGTTVNLTAGGATGGSTHFSSATETATQTVTPVNDAPTLTLLTDAGQSDAGGLSVTGNRGLHVVSGFATAATGPGAATDESGQGLSYSISTNNNGLFSLAPAISADGTLSFTTATGATGSATVSVTLTDTGGTTNGGIDSVADTFTITVNAPAPLATPAVTGLTAGSDTGIAGTTSDTTPTITGTIALSDVTDTVIVYVDGQSKGDATVDPSTGNWTFQVPAALSDGSHAVTAVATDVYSDRSATSNTDTIIIDTSTPSAPVVTGITPATDTGTQGDGITSNTSPVLTGTALANSTVTVYSGASPLGTATADSSGNWSYATSGLTDATYAITAKATNLAGTTGSASTAFDLVIDSTPPAAPAVTGLTAGTDTGTSHTDGITNDTTPTITGTAPDNSTVSVYDGATLLGTATANGTGSWSFVSPGLVDGTHVITATATDAAAVTSAASSAYDITVDTSAPAAPVITGITPATDSGALGDGLTKIQEPVITGTAAANAIITVSDGASVLGTTTADGSGNWQYPTASNLSNGVHALTATATDVAGNVSTASTAYDLTIDTSTPATPAISGITAATDTGTTGDRITADNTPTITGTGPAGDTITLYDSDGTTVIATGAIDGTGHWSVTTAVLSSAVHTITAKAANAAADASTASSAYVLTIDTHSPAAPAEAALTPATDTGNANTTRDTTPSLTGSAEAGSTVTIYINGTAVGTTVAGGGGTWTYAVPSALASGTYSVTTTATDVAGTTGPASVPFNLTIDTHTPAAPSSVALTAETDTGILGVTRDTTPSLEGSAEAGSTVTVYVDGTAVGTAVAGSNGTWTFAIPTALADGTHSITTTATDAAGTVGPASAATTVTIDTHIPVAPSGTGLTAATDTGTIGDSITSDATPGLTGTAEAHSTVTVYIDGTEAGTAVAASNGTWTFAVPSTLADGTHTVTATATDAAGTTGAASSPYAVTIDTHTPAAPAGIGLTAATDTGTIGDGITSDTTPAVTGTAEAGSTVTVYVDGSAVGTTVAANNGAWTYAIASALADGTHSVTTTATDSAGTVSPASSPYAVTIDTHTPATPSTVSLTDGSVTGLGGNDGTTASRTPTLSGTADPGTTITIYDGTTVLGTTLVGPSGSWSFTVPALADGTHAISTTATDVAGTTGPHSAVAAVTIAPTLNIALPNQLWSGGGAQLFTLPAGTFQAPAGDTLTYTASGLPPWVSIDPATGALSGIVPMSSHDMAPIVITATDSHGESVSARLDLSYDGAPVPAAPAAALVPAVLQTPMALPSTPGSTPTLVTVVSGSGIGQTSGDTGTGSGTYGLSPASQSALTGFSAGNTPTLTAASSDGFQIAVVKGTTTGGGDLTTVKPDVSVPENSSGSISYNVGVDTFTHTDPTAVVHLTATLADGAPLPSWLVFNPRTGALSGTPPAGEKAAVIDVRVTAADNQGHQAVARVKLDLKSIDPRFHHTPVALKDIFGGKPHVAARPGLSAQIRSAHRGTQLARDAALLRAAARMVRSG